MESTGVYWIPLFEVLESKGFDVKLVNPQSIKNVPGRKTDVLDCQWIQRLHSFGLLQGSFRPDEQICILRSYLRQRSMLVSDASQYIQRMQKSTGADEHQAQSGHTGYYRNYRYGNYSRHT